ncbi:PAS domain-containing sensor histidine kinase [Ideonella sp. YS5]|uniref:PAS domain-containing sensor histidine kinase n=1 Tax=Ideonella sp. YS5 TaxID=3453714 RepID=UPI003F702E4E
MPTLALAFDDVPFRAIAEQSLAGFYVVQDERFVYANDTFAAMFGFERTAFIGRRIVDCVTEDSVDEVMHNYQRRISGEVNAIHYVTKGVHRDGRVVHLELHASRVECRGRPAIAGVALDITERVQAQASVRESREQLRRLLKHINSTREIERARLAREVHDVLGGMLSSAKFDLSRIVRRTAAPGLEELHAIAAPLVELMQDTIETARSVSEELRPAGLDLLGLGAALTQAVERFGVRHGLATDVRCSGSFDALPPASAMQIYRIVQEALTNVARHAEATQIELQLSAKAGALVLRLADNGRGLDATPRRPGAIGLFSMAERARDIGATFHARPAGAGGTELLLMLPLPASVTPPA